MTLKILVLGSGGAQPPPRPGCTCPICTEARQKGIPYSRTGPSIYLPEENILFDTPEEIREQLNRERIGHVENVFISHWHPDHTMGIRVFEQMNYNFNLRPSLKSRVYISKATERNLAEQLLPSFFPLYQRRGIVVVSHIEEGQTVEFGNLKVTSYKLPESDTFLYRLQKEGKTTVYAPCEILHFPIRNELKQPDLLLLHLGFFKEMVPPDWRYENEDSFQEDQETIKKLGAKKTVFMHIEEAWGKSYDDYKRMEADFAGLNIEFAYDSMRITI